MDRSLPNRRNAELLAAYARQRTTANRNAVVHANLPLVWRVARQESQASGHGFEDLVQVGCIGLIRAVERYDGDRGSRLSTVACPWIRGAIRHYLRDRCRPLVGSHHLLALHRRGLQLQEQRRLQGLPPLAEAALAEALGCSVERWRHGQALRRSLRVASLEQPVADGEDSSTPLVEQLSDPRTPDGYAVAIQTEQRRLLWRSLRQLDRSQRRLVLGRVLLQRPWRELGAQCGLSAKVSQRRFEQLLHALRQQLEPQLNGF